MRLFRERLDGLADPDRPRLRFRPDPALRAADRAVCRRPSRDWRAERWLSSEIAALVDRLSTRLGRGRLRRFMPRDTHIPEQAQLALPAVEARSAGCHGPTPEPGEPPMRPLHLFDPPQPIEVIAEVPDGPPHRFRWRRSFHDVARFEGPGTHRRRMVAQRQDGKGLTRDYYRVEDAHGRRFWIFRHGLYGTEKPHPGWYLHGLFA